jgi:hypothetical protein
VQLASEFPSLRQAGDKRFSTAALLIIFIAGGLQRELHDYRAPTAGVSGADRISGWPEAYTSKV